MKPDRYLPAIKSFLKAYFGLVTASIYKRTESGEVTDNEGIERWEMVVRLLCPVW